MSAMTTDQLLKIGQRNLANQDQVISSANAVNRMRSGTPGVGAPGSNATTDQTNLNLAASMEQSDRGSRFGFDSPEYAQGTDTPAVEQPDTAGGIDIAAINARRNAILNGKDPDNPALYVSDTPNRHGVSRKQQLYSELPALTQVVHDHSLEKARTTHENFLQQRNIDTANDVTGFFDDFGSIKSAIGTPEHVQEVFRIAANHPLALGTAGVRGVLKTHAALHDTTASTLPQRQATSTQDKEYIDLLHQTTEFGKSRGVSPQFDPETGMPSIDLTRQYANQYGPAAKTTPTEAKNIHDIYGFTPAQFGARSAVAETDENGTGKVGGGFVKFTYPDKGKPVATKPIPKADFLKLGGTLAPESMPATTATPPAAAPVAPATNLPAAGEKRTINGIPAVWDGKGWKRAS